MRLPKTVTQYLERSGADYEIVHHPHTSNSMETAEAAHVTGERIAKAVLLEDDSGYLLAVLPATHTLQLGRVREETGRDLGLATEAELPTVFPDCEAGAVPSVGPAYGLETIVDDALLAQPEVYFEAGTHEDLVRLSEARFERLLGDARHFPFSVHRH